MSVMTRSASSGMPWTAQARAINSVSMSTAEGSYFIPVFDPFKSVAKKFQKIVSHAASDSSIRKHSSWRKIAGQPSVLRPASPYYTKV